MRLTMFPTQYSTKTKVDVIDRLVYPPMFDEIMTRPRVKRNSIADWQLTVVDEQKPNHSNRGQVCVQGQKAMRVEPSTADGDFHVRCENSWLADHRED